MVYNPWITIPLSASTEKWLDNISTIFLPRKLAVLIKFNKQQLCFRLQIYHNLIYLNTQKSYATMSINQNPEKTILKVAVLKSLYWIFAKFSIIFFLCLHTFLRNVFTDLKKCYFFVFRYSHTIFSETGA